MVELKIKSWNECPIGIYRKLAEADSDPALTQNEKAVAKAAILCDCSEDEIWSLPIQDASEIFRACSWTSAFDFDKEVKFKKLKVGKYTCKVETDLAKYNVAQYMDFMTYWQTDKGQNLENLLTVFLVPEGKKYGTDYDVADLKEEITWNVSISLAQSVCFFFLKELVSSIGATLIYLDYMTKKMEKKASKEAKEAIRIRREALTSLLYSLDLSRSSRI